MLEKLNNYNIHIIQSGIFHLTYRRLNSIFISYRILVTTFHTLSILSGKKEKKLPIDHTTLSHFTTRKLIIPYTSKNNDSIGLQYLKFHLKTYGCQMNIHDSEIIRSILLNKTLSPFQFEETDSEYEADILLTNTCAIRENAELKVWQRLRSLQSMIRRKQGRQIVGVLGCMAERLKDDMFREGTVDMIVGPDAYRDLPNLLHSLLITENHDVIEKAVNVQLSLQETYSDISPLRRDSTISAFLSIMRGCNNMCSYCVVPFTRGRERSRSLSSLVEEVTNLVHGPNPIKEIVLLGQNVNSYHDQSFDSVQYSSTTTYKTTTGFTNIYKSRGGPGYYFADLLEAIANISPEVRVRFTSPHPKDYPPEVISIMAEKANICKHIHMPAQSGSTTVLQRMRRGYTRESYIELVDSVRSLVPNVALSSDFITGFCHETDDEHADTLSLLEYVQFDMAYMFAYSAREKTHALHTMLDDVHPVVKSKRLQEIINMFQKNVQIRNEKMELGTLQLVLVEGASRKCSIDYPTWTGRTDTNKRVVFPVDMSDYGPLCYSSDTVDNFLPHPLDATSTFNFEETLLLQDLNCKKVLLQIGDYAVVMITQARGHTLRGTLLFQTTLVDFSQFILKRKLKRKV